MSIILILYLVAFVLFLLAAFGVPSRVGWEPLGLAVLTLTLLITGLR